VTAGTQAGLNPGLIHGDTTIEGFVRAIHASLVWHERVLSAFPRLQMKQQFAETCCRLVTEKPETSYDNFLRDFGERFVPGYKGVSTVDLLMNAPFEE
jgi:hypothetical protein